MPRGQPEEAIEHSIDGGDLERIGKHERQQRRARSCAHRGEIAQVHGQGTMPDGIGWYETLVEMNALDLGIGREHLEGATFRFDDGGVVAWADDDPGGESQSRGDPLDERVLT